MCRCRRPSPGERWANQVGSRTCTVPQPDRPLFFEQMCEWKGVTEPSDGVSDHIEMQVDITGVNYLLRLPLDIFAVISHLLAPLDLYNLSFVNKATRALLMSPPARVFWKSARLNAYKNAPTCPQDVPELLFTRFLFVEQCMTCEKPATTANFFYRAKYCDECWNKSFVSISFIQKNFPNFFDSDMKQSKLKSADESYTRAPLRRPYHIRLVEADYKRYKKALAAADAKEDSVRIAFKENFIARQEQAIGVHQWIRATVHGLRLASLRAFRVRAADLRSRLSLLGANSYDLLDTHLLRYGGMELPHKPTDEDWEVMRPQLESVVIDSLATRGYYHNPGRSRPFNLKVHIRHAIQCAEVHALSGVPSDQECRDLPAVKAVLDAYTENIPSDKWDIAVAEVDQLVQNRRATILGQIFGAIGKPRGKEMLTKEDISEAIKELCSLNHGLFCTQCKSVLWFPEALEHNHLNFKPNAGGIKLGCLIPIPDYCSDTVHGVFSELSLADGATVVGSDVRVSCARCDERVVQPNVSLKQILAHHIRSRIWFQDAQTITGHTQIALLDSHDPVDDTARPLTVITPVRAKGKKPPTQASDPDVTFVAAKGTVRLCGLCPPGFSPMPMSTAHLRIHVRARHCEVLKVNQHSTVFETGMPLPDFPGPIS